MKYLRLFEEHHENLDVILSTINDDNADKIIDYIGLKDGEYEIETTYYDNRYPNRVKYNGSELSILMNHVTLERLMDVEEGTINYIQSLASNYGGNYEYYVDDDELNYIHSYLSGSTINFVKYLAHKFDFQIEPEEEGEIKELFQNLGLENILDEIKNEVSNEHESAIKQLANDVLKKLPFELNYANGNKDFEIYFNYEEVITYIKKHNLKVKTIKEFIENGDYDEFDYGIDYSDGKYDFLGNFEDVDKVVRNTCEQYTDYPDELFSKLIEHNKLELIQKKKDLADFYQRYKAWIDYDRKEHTLFELAKHYKNSVLEWFKTYEFQQWFIEEYIDKDDKQEERDANYGSTNYKILNNNEIINPMIKDEYEYLVDSEKYNL